MRCYVIFILILLGLGMADAQHIPPILTVQQYEKGVYRNFTEFFNNSPSVKDQFELKRKPLMEIDAYKIVFNKTSVNYAEGKSFWGFSTGDSIFINTRNGKVGGVLENTAYVLVQEVDRYCYWMDVIENGNLKTSVGRVMNFNNGKIYSLSPKLMVMILQKDETLLEEYNTLRNRDRSSIEVMFNFLKRYNKNHRNEIYTGNRKEKVIVYRKGDKQSGETLQTKTPSGLSFTLGPNDYKAFDSSHRTLTLCTEGICQDFVLTPDEINYIECSKLENGNSITMELQELRAGEFGFNTVKAARDKSSK
jgi:hypothetical protein